MQPYRYSEFDTLRENLVRTFPYAKGALPPLPPKNAFVKFDKKFLEKRKEALGYFLK
jgi:hypothetical protein